MMSPVFAAHLCRGGGRPSGRNCFGIVLTKRVLTARCDVSPARTIYAHTKSS